MSDHSFHCIPLTQPTLLPSFPLSNNSSMITYLTNITTQTPHHTNIQPNNNTHLILVRQLITCPILYTSHQGSSLTVSSESVGRATLFLQGGLNNGATAGRSPVPSHRSGHDASGAMSNTYNGGHGHGHGNINTSNQNYPPQPWQHQQHQHPYPVSVPARPIQPMEIEQPPILPAPQQQQQPKKRSVD